MRDRLLRDAYLLVAVAFVGLRLASVAPWDQSVDAYAYWSTRDGDWYGGDPGAIGAYLYSPAFSQLLTPLVALPWPVFDALWTAVNLAALWWLAGRWALPLLLVIPVPFEIVSGNIHLLIAVAIVAGFRYPATWAFVLLTKVTPGIGLLWFVVRREWRALGWALGATLAIAAVSLVLAPDAWRSWVSLLVGDASVPLDTVGWYLPIPLVPRLAAAAAIVVWGGGTGRRWTVPVAVTLALPIVWLNSLAVLVALVPIVQSQRRAAGRSTALPPAPSTDLLVAGTTLV